MAGTPEKSDPKKAVLLVGAGYGALKVAEDMAQSGIPVVWVTRAKHFLELPRGIDHFEEWPDDLNFQFRPLYLRVTRHPLVTPLTRSRVRSFERDEDGLRISVVQEPEYIDYNLCTGCGKCVEICPLNDTDHPPLVRTPNYCPSRALDLDKRKLPACRSTCPLGVNAQAYMALTAASRFDEALEVIREDNPLPGICGRVCTHPCEEQCRRAELDQAVAIRDIKRFLADYEAQKEPAKLKTPDSPRRPEKVAVIGSGPAGLMAAHCLNRYGFKVTVFEAMAEPGGMLRAGINSFRLPRKVLDAEIKAIENTGVEIVTDSRISSTGELLKKGYKAVILCTGTHSDIELDIPGCNADGVCGAVKMLKTFNSGSDPAIGKNIAVIGGGNSAIDAARTAIRLGAEKVTIYYRRERKDMPAEECEITAAVEEGIGIEYLCSPVSVVERDGKVAGLELQKMELGEIDESGRGRPVPVEGSEFTVDADTVVMAIGQKANLMECGLADELATGRGGTVDVDGDCCTSMESVFAAGDATSGPTSVIDAMCSGRKAAGKVIESLTGEASPFVEITPETRGIGEYVEISEQKHRRWRPERTERQPKARRRDFDEVDLGLTEEQAVAEARRCLQCGSCCECRACEEACGEIGAIDHFRTSRVIEISSPSVIVADADEIEGCEVPEGKGVLDIGDLSQVSDLMDVMVAGSALAGQAMATATDLRTEQPFVENIPPVEMSSEMRIGLFVCSCNGTMAPRGVLDRIKEYAEKMPGVVHSEIIFSACHPKGADSIAESFRDKKLNRAILASCVCCPLEFQCISCNDQRTRARMHLFDRLGLDRSRFEMINIKDHLYTGGDSEDEIFDKAKHLLRQSYVRAKYMQPLRQGTTEMGKRILILGGSEIGLSCALNLDMQGFKVRLVHNCRVKDQPQTTHKRKKSASYMSTGKNIIHVEEAEIEEIRGHVGDFTVVMREGGELHRRHPDMICLTDESVTPLSIHEDMMGLRKLYRYNFKFFHTPQVGLYRVLPRTLNRINAFEAGAALAAQVATTAAEAFLKDHELSPYVNPELCRGCGRCAEICPFDAIKMVADPHGIFTAEVLRHNCVGCGGCVGRCPVTALNMPYLSNRMLEEIVETALAGDR